MTIKTSNGQDFQRPAEQDARRVAWPPGRTDKNVLAEEAIALMQDGGTLANIGFVGSGAFENPPVARQKQVIETGRSRNSAVVG